MTAAEVSREFEIPLSTIYKLAKTNKIPFEDVRPKHVDQRRLRFSRAKITAWLESRRAADPPA